MNGKRSKSIRRYVKNNFPFMDQSALRRRYTQRADGVVMASVATFRSLYQTIKRNYYRRTRGLQLIGIPDSFSPEINIINEE